MAKKERGRVAHKPVCSACGEAWPCSEADSSMNYEECCICGLEYHYKSMAQSYNDPLTWWCRGCMDELEEESA